MLNINSDRNSQTAFDELSIVKTRIENGERFEDLVLEVSEDEGTKEIKGDLVLLMGLFYHLNLIYH